MTTSLRSSTLEATIRNVPRRSGRMVNLEHSLSFSFVPMCTHCGRQNPQRSKFCNECRSPLVDLVYAEERRIVSVLFVDLVDFTRRAETLDPEDVLDILRPYHEAVRDELERFGGVVEKFIGDAVMGVFGAPVAYGDDPERAVRAALAVRDRAARDGIPIRIAVNTGEAIVTLDARPERGEAMVAGDVVNTAARLQSRAPIGAVLVGEEAYASTRGAIEFKRAPPIAAKGKAAPIRAWLAVRAARGVGERLVSPVPMVGRSSEFATLIDVWERATGERRPQLVTIIGDAGIGKSRIALEFCEHIAARGSRVVRGRSTAYGASSPYDAFAQQVKQIARIFDSDELATAQSRLRDALTKIFGPNTADEHARHIAMLMGLERQGEVADREALFSSARALVESLANETPTLLVFEDIHWAEAGLLDLLEWLATSIGNVRLVFLSLARPELLASRPGWGRRVPAYTALLLDRLSDEAAEELANRVLTRSNGDASGAVSIARAADGNPLFIEEFAAALSDDSTADNARLPTSVRAIIGARLDALPLEERSILSDASVLGRVFWRGALASIRPRERLSRSLVILEERGFVRREPVAHIEGEQQFAFKHALIQEVAYLQLPRAARRRLHEAVAEYLENATGSVGESNEALAYHWREAGHHERAVDHLLAAADQAGRGWAKEHAASLYRDALGLIPEDDPRHTEIARMVAIALMAAYHVVDAERSRPR